MFVNSDFSVRAVVLAESRRWMASPQAGVDRVMLDRVGGEVARATSLVRYAQASKFPRHEHGGGEEILVLAGTFTDESGDYPAGWYLRNPPGSSHAPSSEPGALIFVKLRQVSAGDRRTVRLDTGDAGNWTHDGPCGACELHAHGTERVRLERVPARAAPRADRAGGLELLVIGGEVWLDGQRIDRGGWLRLPPGDPGRLVAGAQGATAYVKTGHLVPQALR